MPITTLAPSSPIPSPVRPAVLVWLAAVGLGVAETAVHLAMPDPPGPAALVLRAAVYLGVVALVLSLRTGRPAVRWVLVVLLGGLGTLSLVVEPLRWLLAGGDPAAFLAGADPSTLLVVALRTGHLALVLVGLVAVFGHRANAFFARRS